jgi:two-component system cell cycle response regulator
MIVDSMDQGLLIVERCGRIQYANPACDRYLGYATPDELVGRSLADLLAQQDAIRMAAPRWKRSATAPARC